MSEYLDYEKRAQRYGRDFHKHLTDRPELFDPQKIWPAISPEYHQRIGYCGFVLDKVPEYNSRVREVLAEAINKGDFEGRPALEAVAYQIVSYNAQMYHGSSILPEQLGAQLQPAQPYWRDAQNRRYKDGEPGICFAENFDTPIFMALLGSRVPGIEEYFRAYGHDEHGKLWRIVALDALEVLRNEDRRGCIYTVDKPLDLVRYQRAGTWVNEWRLNKATEYRLAVRVGVKDLPDDVLVVDGDRKLIEDIWQDILHGVHPLELAEQGAVIAPLGESWDITDHPVYR